MEFRRRAIAVGITFFLAAATGHLMQNADAISAFLRGEAQPPSQIVTRVEPTVGALIPAAASTLVGAAETMAEVFPALPRLPEAEPVAFTGEAFLAKRIKMLGTEAAIPNTSSDGGPEVFGFRCGDSAMEITSQPPAVLNITLSSPCHPHERVVFHHSGLSFATMTDISGFVAVSLPALSRDGAVRASIAGQTPLTGSATVPDLNGVARIAVQVGRVPGLHIASDPGEGGFLTRLGDPELADPLLAEVFTSAGAAPTDAPLLEGTALEANCGRTIAAKSFRTSNAGEPTIAMLKMAMPGCEALLDMVVMPLVFDVTTQVAAAN